ncbi:avidin/streptavidin family protein [Luteimicrobium sp. NPDC057192]|uniref:avidin/streptavidin family protein n=1 Tax=Luteimicrobium sp. NPDC057192 TaxID=3346042 RepID=UPI00364592F4
MGDTQLWLGRWVNQYGSVIEITEAADGRVAGLFRTALPDSALAGRDVPLAGTYDGEAIACSAAGSGTAVSYTGTLVDGRLETLWAFVDGSAPWWRAITTNHDTFERRP